MSIAGAQAIEATHNGKPLRGIYRRETGTFEVSKGVHKIGPLPEYEYSFDFTAKGKRFRSVFGLESQFGKIGARGTWESDALNAAAEALVRFKANAKSGVGPTSVAEERSLAAIEQKERETAARSAAEAESRRNISISDFFESVYLPQAKHDKKPDTWGTEERLFRHWIAPVIGQMTFGQISIEHLNEIKRNMASGKRGAASTHLKDKNKKSQELRNPSRPMTPKTQSYALAVVRQIWNLATAVKPPLAFGAWPGASKQFRMPKFDNKRRRFLTQKEAEILLSHLLKKSKDVHDMALLALHCGLRAEEIFKLTWNRANFSKNELLLVDTKTGDDRTVYLTDATLAMLKDRYAELSETHNHIFINTLGQPYNQVPSTFSRVVKELGFNKGVTDTRDRVVFHSLRHTFASWLVDHGTNIKLTGDLLGHKTLIMTTRYTHTTADAQRAAVATLNKSLTKNRENVIQLQDRRKICNYSLYRSGDHWKLAKRGTRRDDL